MAKRTLTDRILGKKPAQNLASADAPVLTVHIGDLHVGSTVALCPEQVPLDDGGVYHASDAQQWYWDCWLEFWRDTAELKQRFGARCVGVFGGDIREGDHHNTTQVWARNPNDQMMAVFQTLAVAEEVVDDWVLVRGTPAHSGPASCVEEGAAQALHEKGFSVIRNGARFSWWVYQGEHQGVRVQVKHQPGTMSWVPHTRDAAASRQAQYTWEEHHKSGIDAPDLAVFHHVHVRARGWYEETACFFVPGWQLPTNWVKRRLSAPKLEQPGGVRVLCQGGSWQPFWLLFRPERMRRWTT